MYNKWLKHIIDRTTALLALILFSPLIILITLINLIIHKGQIWYVQKRIGLNEKPFLLFKFRTLFEVDAIKGNEFIDPVTHEVLHVSSWGKLLRSYGLDELPQLINIIFGELSWIGPRPLLPEYLPFYTENERKRHTVKPGITGLAQIKGRNKLNWDDRLKYDSDYAEKLSFLLDLKIGIKTLIMLFSRQKHYKDISLIDARQIKTAK